MKTGNIEILDLDFEYKLWKNKIIFYRSEVDLLYDRLHVLSREQPEWNLEENSKILLEIQLKSIRTIDKQIRTQEQEMAFYAEDYPVNTKHIHYVTHENIRREMDKINYRHSEIMSEIYPVLCYPLSTAKSV